MALADLPSLDVLRATLLGLLNAPATKLVVLLNTPATQLARVIKAKAEKGLKQFPSALASGPDKQTNNNVNRRFTNELKKAVACRAEARRRRTAADDETTRKVTWLTLQTSWRN